MSTSKKRILWVDDDASFIDAQMSEVRQHYNVDIARGADEFWSVLENAPRDYYVGIIMDILLPYGTRVSAEDADSGLRTGLALIELLKQSEKYRGIPILVFTIRSSADVDELAEKYSIPVVRKQDSLEELVAAARRTFS